MKKKIVAVMCLAAMLLTSCGKANVSETVAEPAGSEETAVQTESEESAQEAGDEALVTIVNHPLTCKVGENVRATGTYPELILSDSYATQYPKLKETLTYLNDEIQDTCENEVGSYATWAEEEADYWVELGVDPPVYVSEYNYYVERADDVMFSILVSYYMDAGGAHPGHGNYTYNIDPKTGNYYVLNQLLEDASNLSDLIRGHLSEDYPEVLEEVDDYYYGENEVFADKLAENTYTWLITDKGLDLIFSPYEIASYAAGYSEAVISYEEAPNLVKETYRQRTAQDLDHLVSIKEAEPREVEALADEDESDGTGFHYMDNPSWDYYCDVEDAPQDAKVCTLTMVSDTSSDWINPDTWFANHAASQKYFPYDDGVYSYTGSEPVEYDFWYTDLTVTELDTDNSYEFYLGDICNGPDQATGTYSHVNQYIQWAQVVDQTLYVSVCHHGYTEEEPNGGYILAIDLVSGTLLWKSKPQVSNADNFVVVGDTIICGYGYTAEPDNIYLLNRYTGEVAGSIPVRTAASWFEVNEDLLYVLTYNTDYTFRIE